MIEMETKKERFILVGVDTGDKKMEASLVELAELVETAGGEVIYRVVQNLDSINRTTYIGSGKIKEIVELIEESGADGVVCDDELSPSQLSNLRDELGIKVLDRTLVILDIFADHAKSGEGKLQVEMAQLRYRSTRLVGLGKNLSRLGGGIGTRGPGESKLEMDRRLIRERISVLKGELEKLENSRDLIRRGRSSKNIPTVAIVGYTNAGKSTLLNTITSAGILAEDKLFATLDPTTRGLRLESGEEILFTDTVGFINKLPHSLIEAFKSTLNEVRYADILLHVVDASNIDANEQIEVVYKVLKELRIENKKIITLFNKMDLLEKEKYIKDERADYEFFISAKTGEGIEEVLKKIEEILRLNKIYIDTLIPYEAGSKISLIRKKGQIISEEYENNGTRVKAYVPKEVVGQLNL